MTSLRALSWLWNGLALLLMGAAAAVHVDVRRDVDAHGRALEAAARRAARRAAEDSWRDAAGRLVESAPRWIRALAFAPPSRSPAEVAAGAADGTVRFHDVATGRPLRAWTDHHGRAVTALAWVDPVVISGDMAGGVTVADASSGAVRWTGAIGQEVVTVTAHPGRDAVLAVGRDGARHRFALSTGAPAGSIPPSPYTVLAFDDDAGDGAVAWAAVGGNLRAWNAWTDARVGHARVDATRRVDAVAFDAERARAALARRDRVLSIRDTGSGALLAEWTEESAITCLAFSPDGSLLFAGGADGAVATFDAATGRRIGTMKAAGDQLAVLRCAPDGATLVAGGRRGALHLFHRAAQ